MSTRDKIILRLRRSSSLCDSGDFYVSVNAKQNQNREQKRDRKEIEVV